MRIIINIAAMIVVLICSLAYANREELKYSAYMYVYDDSKDVWNRARLEDLKNAKCEHIRAYNAYMNTGR